MGEIERNEFDLGGFVVFGFMGLGFLVRWWVCKHGLVVESGGAIGLLVGLISMVAGGFVCWGRRWVCLCSYQIVSKRWSEGYFCTFKNGCHVCKSLLAINFFK